MIALDYGIDTPLLLKGQYLEISIKGNHSHSPKKGTPKSNT